MNLLKNIIVRVSKSYKGKDYKIDSKISSMVLLKFIFRRLFNLYRSFFKRIVISINPNKLVFLGSKTKIYNKDMIKFGKGVTIGDNCIINGLSKNGLTFGDNVNIGPFTIIEATGVITNLGIGCKIGNNSGLGAFSFIGSAGGVTIGNDVIMGQRISFHSENHNFSKLDKLIRLQGVTRKGIVIKNNCWIGANVTFLDGACVNDGSIVAAGAVVTKEFPPNSIIGGVPAKLIRLRSK